MQQLQGTRLWLTVTGVCLALLLTTLESSIVATALVSIAGSLGDYAKSSYVVECYLLTYTSFLAIFARLSDVYGRKRVLLLGLAAFIVWAIACGAAQSLTQLLVFRALCGIGGSAVFSLSFALVADITPPKHFGTASAAVSGVFAASSILGPILGGAISSNTTWRWVFYLNGPIGAVAFGLLLITCPDDYKAAAKREVKRLSQIDWPGFGLLVAACALIVYGIEEGGISHTWNAPRVIATLAAGGSCWIIFISWEVFLSSKKYKGHWLPVFPIRLVTSRVTGAVFASAFLTGFPFQAVIIYLPQRFQLANGLSPAGAGVRMLPLLLVSAVGSGVAGGICSKTNLSFYTLCTGLSLQVVGLGLLSSLPTSISISAAQYGYQAILGLGFGMSLSSIFVMIKAEVSEDDLAVGIGSSTQVRVLGGLVGVAIGQAVISATLKSSLDGIASPQVLSVITESISLISELPPGQAAAIRLAYGHAFNDLMRVALYIAVASLCITAFAFRVHPPALVKATTSNTRQGRPAEEEEKRPVQDVTRLEIIEDRG